VAAAGSAAPAALPGGGWAAGLTAWHLKQNNTNPALLATCCYVNWHMKGIAVAKHTACWRTLLLLLLIGASTPQYNTTQQTSSAALFVCAEYHQVLLAGCPVK
jgi:hypothetical protein